MRAWKQKRQSVWQSLSRILLVLFIVCALPAAAHAAQSASSHYQVNEVFFGSGGELHACSTGQYCAKESAGETAVGRACSTGQFCAQAGFNTDRTPYIQFTVSNTNVDLGTMTPAITRTATSTFSVKAYLSHGYSVVNASDPPSNNGYVMHTSAVPGPNTPGVEQFGINLAANTDPTNFGANPQYQPDNTFSFGQVAVDYSTPNQYKYAKGDTVASSDSSSSSTVYTVSYIFNVSNVTPGGHYNLVHVLVATATY